MKVIAYDIGTTGLKTCMFHISKTESVRLIDGDVEPYALHILDNGGVEQVPEEWWDAMSKSTKRLLKKTGIPKEEIEGISFCSQMQTLVMVDEKGNPLRRSMSCMDTRAGEQFARYMKNGLQIEGLNIYKVFRFLRITGAVSASTKDPIWKYHWVKDNEPEIYRKTYKWLDAKEYLTCRATGNMMVSRDVASATFLYDVKKGQWSKELCKMFDIDMNHLPELCDSTDNVGGLLPKAADELGLSPNIPVFSGGSDVSLCQVGAGCLEVGDVNFYSGTSGWVCTTVERLHLDLGNIIGALVGADPNTYCYIAELETSGKCMEWVKDRIDLPEMDYEGLIEYIKDTPAGSNGVVFSPWMHGNRCPFEDHNAKGVFFNLGITTRGSDLVKSVIEGVCMHMRWMLEATEKTFKTSEVVRFTGGSAISPQICQILADIIGREVETIENPRNVGTMGAAGLMAVSFGLIPEIKDIKDIIRVKATYKPNKENTLIYNKIFPVFKDLIAKKMDNLVNDKLYNIKTEAMDKYLTYFDTKCKRSKAMNEEAKGFIPGGVQHNLAFNYPFPLAIDKAEGPYLYDIDGNRYVDYLQAGGPTLLGSNYKPVTEKVIEIVRKHGPVTGLFHEYELKLAKLINEYMPWVEQYRCFGSGTEADMAAIRLARVFTGKQNILKEGGGYHGWSDQLVYSLHIPYTKTFEAHGIPEEATAHTGEWYPGNIDSLRKALEANEKKGGTAAVIIEPFGPESGTRIAHYDYCAKIRELCDEFDALLIFDEVVTAFRVGPGGAQGFFNVKPDITVFGKIVSGGFPMAGGVGGREDIMSCMAAGVKAGKKRAYVGGTLTANPLSCAAGYYALREIVDKDAGRKAGENGDKLCAGIQGLIDKYELPFVVWNMGSILHFEVSGVMYLSVEDPDIFKKIPERQHHIEQFGAALTANGVITLAGSRIYTSMADNDETIKETLSAFNDVFKNIER
ncbi:MAG TPA: aminotransferase class III-fold pyridoxal phosphate-dependent enzyme [Anaerovoracaceae bacterium]|nr:aminotransferase class III-fold pyridoxal phosphate-dependent enzyme [Anaerovoracaceae bacterium]